MFQKAICNFSKDNLLHNVKLIKKFAPDAKIMAIVKDNAYGHGVISVSKILEEHVDAFGLVLLNDAITLRNSGIRKPIVLIEGVYTPESLLIASLQEFSVVFHCKYQIDLLKKGKLPNPIHAWLKLNIGMGRLGFYPDDARIKLQFLEESPSVIETVGIISHLACASQPQHPLNRKQIDIFKNFIRDFKGQKSLCNSAGIFAFPDVHYDWIRPGIALYGCSPFSEYIIPSLNFKPVMTLQTEIIAIQKINRGEMIGYGGHFCCPEDMLIGIADIGYGDGYPCSKKSGMVLVNGVRCPVIAPVMMDTIIIDIRPCENVEIGDKVILWGEDLPIEEVALSNERIVYDLMVGVKNVYSRWQ